MKAKRPAAARGTDERRRTPRQPARRAQTGAREERKSSRAREERKSSRPREERRNRRSPDAPPRRGRPRATDTAPITRPQIKPVRPKNASQAKARAKARKAKAPKVVRPPLRERLLARISEIDLNPRTLVARVPFVVLVIGSLGLGLGVTLWLSTDAAERSYELGSARETNQALLQQKEALERDVLEAQAAPALAESARELGMIPSRDTAHLVQDPAGNWIVVGTPKPAEGVPPPPLNTPLPEDNPAPPAQAAASRPAPPVVEPRERVVRMPEAGQPAAPAAPAAPVAPAVPAAPVAPTAPVAPPPAPDAAGIPLAAPVPDSPHGVSGQPPGPAVPPAEAPQAPLADPLAAGQPAAPAPAAPAEQFGPLAVIVPGSPT
ncbi:hypothetical protein [Mycobacterium sp. ITM-2016-00318]|uniref:hypothetical protein n=1 Tax=Mycobacterium sp. ITM-2016-00318 TaxID=2099693 RepID=UPI000CFA4C5E|nr:hypothetical protein [Mycobacterium sp. ITM-2016-00318]WNG91028.1 hypothetical protein C6A82_015995 [Mycobacterium sp. ITM-2016-00318]